jgi:hypothetical protein
MTELRGFPESQGPGWWQASDGRWYSPETAPGYAPPAAEAQPDAAAVATAAPEPAAPRTRPPILMFAALGVFAAGLVLAIIGLVVGGPDEGARADLRADIDRNEAHLETAQAALSDAEDAAATVVQQAGAYMQDAQAILSKTEESCGCGEDVSTAVDELVTAIDQFAANPSQAGINQVNVIIDTAVNPEMDRLLALQDDIRVLMVDRAAVPGTS